MSTAVASAESIFRVTGLFKGETEAKSYDYPETEKEHLETAASIWGRTLEDYGLTLDTSGNLETKEAIDIE